MTRHLSGAESAAVVQTPYLREVRVAINQMAKLRDIVVVEGASGLGKSFATDLVTAALPVRTYWIDMPNQPRGKETLALMHKSLLGVMPQARTSSYVLREEVLDALKGRDCALVVDEAQNLSQESLRELRHFHDKEDETKFLLVLVGCGVHQHISKSVPELVSRVGRWVEFKAFTGGEMRAVLDVYHPIFTATDVDVLVSLYEAFGGNFRNWARVLEITQTLQFPPKNGISKEGARAIIHTAGTTVPTTKRGRRA